MYWWGDRFGCLFWQSSAGGVRLKVHGEECAAESPAGFRGRAEQLRWSRGAPWSCRLFSPGVETGLIGFLKMLQDVPLGQAYSHVRHYGWGGGTPIFSHRFCANLVSGPGGQWGGGSNPSVASPLTISSTRGHWTPKLNQRAFLFALPHVAGRSPVGAVLQSPKTTSPPSRRNPWPSWWLLEVVGLWIAGNITQEVPDGNICITSQYNILRRDADGAIISEIMVPLYELIHSRTTHGVYMWYEYSNSPWYEYGQWYESTRRLLCVTQNS